MEAAAPRVAVYGHVDSDAYLLNQVFPHAQRIRVRVGESGDEVLQRLPDGIRWFVFHVNLTYSDRVPTGRAALLASLRARGIEVLNGRVLDISKTTVQRACAGAGLGSTLAGRDGDPAQLVIVKTDCNCGGLSEVILKPADREILDLAHQPTPAWTRDYPVLPRGDVPPETWDAGDFVVERFVSNRSNRFFRAYVVRDRLVVSRVVDPEPVKRMPAGIPREDFFFTLEGPAAGRPVLVHADADDPPGDVAGDVARFCLSFGLDFGALDVVQDDDGASYIVDVNTTPVWGKTGHRDILEFLATGLRDAGGGGAALPLPGLAE
ncbi:MAG TPA: hypothetical protein VHG51_16650 [Longimicrobiaceae bacterium]|nr:hypothetical protein [Longimicrobiaceae bacterium]